MKKVILHLCADIGSDSYPYACDDDYQVILIGERYGVQNVTRQSLLRDYGTATIHGIIANPECADLRSLCSQNFAKAFKAVNP